MEQQNIKLEDFTLQTIDEDSKEFDESKLNSPFLDQRFFGIKSFNRGDISKNDHNETIHQPALKLTSTIFNNSNNITEYNSSTINSEANREEQEPNISSSNNFPKSTETTHLLANIPEDVIRYIKEVSTNYLLLIYDVMLFRLLMSNG